jgi:hypothetical protein
MEETSEAICDAMRNRLIKHRHIDTGALLQSIRHETGIDGNTVTSYIIADAKNPANGAQYAEFLELGTGAAHGRPGGRAGYWRYQDRNGNWHTTDGMDADPFISPSVEEHLDDIQEIAADIVYDIEKYWKLKGGTA